MKFTVFDPKKLNRNRVLLIIPLVFILILGYLTLEYFNINPQNALSFGWLLSFFGIILFSLKALYSPMGVIVFNNDSIDIRIKNRENHRYFLSGKNKIRLHYTLVNKFFYQADVEIYIQNEKQKIVFCIRNKKQRENFIKCIEKYYLNGYPFSETEEAGAKVFLTRSNLKYNDIQRIKEKYGISWVG